MRREFDFYLCKGDATNGERVYILSRDSGRGHAVFLDGPHIGWMPWHVSEMAEIPAKRIKRATVLRRYKAAFVKFAEASMVNTY